QNSTERCEEPTRALRDLAKREQIRNHRDAVRTRFKHCASCINCYASDRHKRFGSASFDFADSVKPNCRVGLLLCVSLKDWADGDVINRLRIGSQSLFQRMSRKADDSPLAKQQPRAFGQQVVLAQVNTVGPDRYRDIYAIVDDDLNTKSMPN